MQTEVLTCETPDARARSIKRAGEILRAGGMVAFPTETVYGLGVVAGDPAAETRLRETRGRADDKPFTVAIADPITVSRFVEFVPALGRRLMSRCWPGPLTIVFENPDGRTVGLRLPGSDLAAKIIEKAGGAVLLPSANLAGGKPAANCFEALDVFDGKIDAIVDGGPVLIGEASTVVRLRGKSYEILRQGALSESRVRRAANLVILFVCSGNSCRSPMAEALCRKMLAERQKVDPESLESHGYSVLSAGSAGGFAAPATPMAIQVMRELGVDISNHLSQTVTSEMVERSDRIFVMTPEQMDQMLRLSPGAAGRVSLLDAKGRAVGDPHGGDIETYRRCAFVIKRALEKRMKEL